MVAVMGGDLTCLWLLVTCTCCVALLSSSPLTSQPNDDYQGSFWQITDIHWDQRYSEVGDPLRMCHKAYSFDGSNSIYGNYRCDAPWPLVKSAIQAMVKINDKPDFILWTGDNAPHTDDPEPDFSVIFRTLSNITGELRTAFQSSVPILPVLGNHDAYPKNDYPVAGEDFYGKYLNQGSWSILLPPEAQEDFKRGGYYSYQVASGVTVLVINTNLYYAYNTLGVNASDPCGQFAWMESKLQSAQKEKSKVIITAHAPPGYFERMATEPFFNSTYNDVYVDLLNEYGEVILVQIYGHEHTDSFKLFSGSKGDVKSVALLAPSVTPWLAASVPGGTAINPSIRLYAYTATSILDYSQYHLNLSKLTNPADEALYTIAYTPETIIKALTPRWELFYQVRETYGLSSLNTTNMARLHDMLKVNDSLFQKYYGMNSAGYDNGPCDSECKRSHLCAIAYLKVKDVVSCMRLNTTDSHLSLKYLAKMREKIDSNIRDSNYASFIMALITLSMTLTVIMSVILAVMLVMIVIKRRRMTPTDRSVPILDLAINHKRNYRQLP